VSNYTRAQAAMCVVGWMGRQAESWELAA
jgi:hypothetical protein